MMSGLVWSVRYLSSSFLSTTERQFIFRTVRRLGLYFGLCLGTLSGTGFVLFGDENACGDPILLLASEGSAQSSTELFV